METVNQPVRKIHVSARLWFDGMNTYHSVCVIENGKELIDPYSYGYGDHYRVTAAKLLGVDERVLRRGAEGFEFTFETTNVKRRKDMHNGGRRTKAPDSNVFSLEG